MSFGFSQRVFLGSRRSQSLSNEGCQNILYKTVFEHFKELKWIAALLLASKSFQNSSFGANFLVNFAVHSTSILLLHNVLSPSSCFSLQFVGSLIVDYSMIHSQLLMQSISSFVDELVKTKYFRLQLRSLALNFPTKYTLDSFFGSNATPWPKLECLALADDNDVDDSMMARVVQCSPHLTSLNLCRSSNLTDVGLGHVSALAGLKYLDLSWNTRITDAGLEHLSALSNIVSLNLTRCKTITSAGLLHLSQLSYLDTLILDRCARITDDGLRHISGLNGLTMLDLAWCKQISDVGIQHISQLSGITDLNLSACQEVTDVGIDFVATRLSNITSLNLYGSSITDIGLQHVSKLPRIIKINLSSCSTITPSGKKAFNDAKPDCEIKKESSSLLLNN